ncbi:serine/threonine-protein kinase [Kitasatospora sp. NPDC001539]|uniref:serine/threonine-protein kinase n=1 Tax=Kitasatospora sp. NPDC001539 TaxID=3154384 RepID=UPI00333160E5
MALLENDPREIGGYRLEDRLGAGGMGVVYLARSLSGRQVAVKVIRADLASDTEFRARFRHEVAAARLVSGAFTAPVVDADADAVLPWLATLYIPGPSLAQRVAARGPFTGDEVRRLAVGLAEALQDIHRAGLVHRDLKPGNVLLAQDGPRVIDFGIARALDGTQLTSTGVAVGTPPFMAPEQFRDGTADPATDVFALGSVLVFAATGRGPFGGDSSHAVGYRVVHEEPDLTGVPAELVPLVTACLAKDPAGRPTADQLLQRLAGAERTAADRPQTQPTAPATVLDASVPGPAPAPEAVGVPDGAARPSGRRGLIVGATLLALAAAAGLSIATWPSGTYDNPTPLLGPDAPPGPVTCGPAGDAVIGADTQQAVLVDRWTQNYHQACPTANLTAKDGTRYGAAGDDFAAGRVAAAVLDVPPGDQDLGSRCAGGRAVRLPVDVTPIAVVYNVPGAGQLILDAPVIARIFNRQIVSWDDPAIQALNPASSLPAKDIIVYRPSGELSTTLAFTRYLAAAAPADWPFPPSASWPAQAHGTTQQTLDLTGRTADTPYSISFAPLAASGKPAAAGKLGTASLPAGPGGAPVPAKPQAATTAAASARVAGSGADLTVSPTYDQLVPGGYPLIQIGYAVYCDHGGTDDRSASAVAGYLSHVVSGTGQLTAENLGYAQLPPDLLERVRAVLKDQAKH